MKRSREILDAKSVLKNLETEGGAILIHTAAEFRSVLLAHAAEARAAYPDEATPKAVHWVGRLPSGRESTTVFRLRGHVPGFAERRVRLRYGWGPWQRCDFSRSPQESSGSYRATEGWDALEYLATHPLKG